MIIRLPHCYPVQVRVSLWHWAPDTNGGVKHGPQSWPWWRLPALKLYRLDVHAPSSGWALWLYTRWGAIPFDLYIDRRPAR